MKLDGRNSTLTHKAATPPPRHAMHQSKGKGFQPQTGLESRRPEETSSSCEQWARHSTLTHKTVGGWARPPRGWGWGFGDLRPPATPCPLVLVMPLGHTPCGRWTASIRDIR